MEPLSDLVLPMITTYRLCRRECGFWVKVLEARYTSGLKFPPKYVRKIGVKIKIRSIPFHFGLLHDTKLFVIGGSGSSQFV